MFANKAKTKGKLISFTNITLLFSVFILAAVIFSRLVLLGFESQKQGSANKALGENLQILGTKDKVIASSKENTLPDSFPADIPIYPKTKLENAWVSSSKNIEGISVIWESDDPIDYVVSYYKQEFLRLGWTTKVVLDEDSSFTLSFKKEKVEGFMGVTEKEGRVVISLTVGIRK